MKIDQKLLVPELIQRFVNDMVFDCHGFTARFERSGTQKELVLMGQNVLGSIADFLKAHAFTAIESGMDLEVAFCKLLNLIGIGLGQEVLAQAPQHLTDIADWTNWAERHQNS